jgi:MarR family transcriptional regulator for hemolysin
MDLETAFVGALRRVTLKWRSRFDAELRGSGQTLGRARALMLLSGAGGGMTQRELAAELSIEHPTLVRLLDGLERHRLIEREPVPGDRRANRIVLTPQAAPVVAEVQHRFDALRHRVLRDIPPADMAIALRVLDSLLDSLDLVPEAGDGAG